MMSNLSQVATQSHATSEPRNSHTLGAREQISPTGGPEQDPLQVQINFLAFFLNVKLFPFWNDTEHLAITLLLYKNRKKCCWSGSNLTRDKQLSRLVMP